MLSPLANSFDRGGAGAYRPLNRLSKSRVDIIQRLGELRHVKVHAGCVNTIAWNAAGTRLLSGSDDQRLLLCDPLNHQSFSFVRTRHRANIFSAKFLCHSNDEKVVSCSGDGAIYVSHLEGNHMVSTEPFTCHGRTCYEVETSITEPFTFFSAGEDGTVRWYDLRTKSRCQKSPCTEDILISLPRGVTTMDLHPTKPWEISIGCCDARVKGFDRRMMSTKASGDGVPWSKGKPGIIYDFIPPGLGRPRRITSLKHSADGNELLVSYSEENVYLYDLKSSVHSKEFSAMLEKDKSDKKAGLLKSISRLRNLRTEESRSREKSGVADGETALSALEITSPPSAEDSAVPGESIVALNTASAATATDNDEAQCVLKKRRFNQAISFNNSPSLTPPAPESINLTENNIEDENLENSVEEIDSGQLCDDRPVTKYFLAIGDGPARDDPAHIPIQPKDSPSCEIESSLSSEPSEPSVESSEISPMRGHLQGQEKKDDNESFIEGTVDIPLDNQANASTSPEPEASCSADTTRRRHSDSSLPPIIGFRGGAGVSSSSSLPSTQSLFRAPATLPRPATRGSEGSGVRPPMKRLRLRGDWSDTGPNARPESERGGGEPEADNAFQNFMRRMSHVFTRFLAEEGSEGEGSERRGDVGSSGDFLENVESADVEPASSTATGDTDPVESEQESSSSPQPPPSVPVVRLTLKNQGVDASSVEMVANETELANRRQLVEESDCGEETPSAATPYSTGEPSALNAEDESLAVSISESPAVGALLSNSASAAKASCLVVDDEDSLTNKSKRRKPNEEDDDEEEGDDHSSPSSTRPSCTASASRRAVAAAQQIQRFYRRKKSRGDEDGDGDDEGDDDEDLARRRVRNPEFTDLGVKMVYKGHRNSRTMIKEANFWGDDYVVSGSDCGRLFFWRKSDARLVNLLEADKHVVNCVQPHPEFPILASSGIDYDIKIWAPVKTEPDFDEACAERVVKRNELMLAETRNTVTIPASFMLRMLASLNQMRGGRRGRGRFGAARRTRFSRDTSSTDSDSDW